MCTSSGSDECNGNFILQSVCMINFATTIPGPIRSRGSNMLTIVLKMDYFVIYCCFEKLSIVQRNVSDAGFLVNPKILYALCG